MDARLSMIDFNKDNRGPEAVLEADVTKGAVPLTVAFSGSRSADPDGDPITFELHLNGQIVPSEKGAFTQTFEKPGIYRPKLVVKDSKGFESAAEITIIAGNEPPVLDIEWNGNSQFYLANTSGNYSVSVTDKEDGSLSDGKIAADRVTVSFDYLAQGYDMTGIAQGHQRSELPGKILMAESDCKSCHLIDEKSAGPAYRDVARKYKKDPQAIEKLANKIISGGAGVWGETAMAAHPQISKENAMLMVEYILSLASDDKKKSLPVKGSVSFNPPPPPPNALPKGAYILMATYDDRGNGSIPSLGSEKTLVLRVPYLSGTDVDELNGPRKLKTPDGGEAVEAIKHNSSVTFKDVDLTGVGKFQFSVVEIALLSKGGKIEIYLDGKDGQKLGTVGFENAPEVNIMAGINLKSAALKTKTVEGKHDLVLVFTNPEAGDGDLFIFAGVGLEK